ncbi:MAG: cation transporter [Clostridia bacterium]|nr:cation transporter [Clostridia bacterium]
MNKVYKLKGLDCAHCAQKLEKLIADVEGVTSSKIAFVLQKLSLGIKEENSEEIISNVMQVIEDFGEGEIEVKEL